MTLERALPWLDDMLDAIDWIGRLTTGRTIADYRADRPMRDAVERNIERLSEASRHLPPELTAAHPDMRSSPCRSRTSLPRPPPAT